MNQHRFWLPLYLLLAISSRWNDQAHKSLYTILLIHSITLHSLSELRLLCVLSSKFMLCICHFCLLQYKHAWALLPGLDKLSLKITVYWCKLSNNMSLALPLLQFKSQVCLGALALHLWSYPSSIILNQFSHFATSEYFIGSFSVVIISKMCLLALFFTFNSSFCRIPFTVLWC